VAAAAMAGVPLLNGFLSKEMFFAETIFAGEALALRIGLPAAATLAGVFSVAYSARFVHRVFFGPPATRLHRTPHEPAGWMLVPIALLVVVCLLVGILPARMIGPLLHNAAQAIVGPSVPEYSLAVWHGFNLPLIMSLIALVGGAGLYLVLYYKRDRALQPSVLVDLMDGKRNFDVVIVALMRATKRLMELFSSRRLQTQLMLMVVAVLALTGMAITRSAVFPDVGLPAPLDPAFALLWGVGAACALGAATQAKFHRLAALIMVGGAGLVTCLTFAWFSAPDLALTQLSVEVVTVVLILLGLRWLPKRFEIDDPSRRTLRARVRRVRDFTLAAAAGTGMAGLSYVVLTRPQGPGIGPYFLENALSQGGGRNVVNVILVDFRGFDTLGEITVVGIVALTVYKLLRRFRPAPESVHAPSAQHADIDRDEPHDLDAALPAGDMKIPAVLGRLLLPVAAVISIFFLLRGHNAPGGGFVGGLVVATAFIVQYMVSGTVWIENRIRIHPQYWIGGGLLAAAGAGVGAGLASLTFLTSLEWHGRLPLLGELHLSSTLLFDIGVYMLVIGATTLMLIALAHQSLRGHRRPVPTQVTAQVRG
jgi:multicomponent K+:H+ antiporter subunit A